MAEQVAQQFTEFYYKTFGALSRSDWTVAQRVQTPIERAWRVSTSVSGERLRLISQRDHSMMTWESSPFMGSKAIVEKLSVSWAVLRHVLLLLFDRTAELAS